MNTELLTKILQGIEQGKNLKTISKENYYSSKEVVRILRLTEKQYDNITMITGEPDYQEQTVGTNCHIMI